MSVVASLAHQFRCYISLLYMRNDGKQARCENCGRIGVQVRPVTRSYGKGATLLVIEKVPVISCPHCGASYLTAQTLRELARIKLHRRSMSKRRSVAVAEFVSPE
jgi:YgiT-type zinc finger domain-containing protein